jgi:hypothetical protein
MSYCDLCGGEIKTGDDGCIIHRDDPEKEATLFAKRMRRRYKHKQKLERIIFPKDYPRKEFLEIIRFDKEVSFERCKFYCRFNTSNKHYKYSVRFLGCHFHFGLDMAECEVGGSVVFKNCAIKEHIIIYKLVAEKILFSNPFVPITDDITELNLEGAGVTNEIVIKGRNPTNLAFERVKINFKQFYMQSEVRVKMHYVDLSDCSFLGTNVADIEYVGVKWCQVVPARYNPLRRVGIRDEIKSTDEDPSPAELRSGIEEVYRQLKVNYEAKGDYSRAGDFHIGEKEQRRLNPNTTVGLKSLLTAYKLLSGYGERPLMPFIWLVGLWLATTLIYTTLGATDPGTATSVGGGTVLLDSFRATFVPINPLQYEGLLVGWVSVGHRIFAGVLLALLALAIRQRVKR